MAAMGQQRGMWARAAMLSASMVCVPALEAWAASAEIITVTGTRREVALDTVAGNIARLDGNTVAFINADHVAETLNRLPGVFLHRNSGQDMLTAIRSPVLTGGAGAGSFLFLEDGVPLRAAGFANVNGLFEGLTELSGAVEVVRGPGSALYGSNAVHGLINILTPAPTEDLSGGLRLTGGSFGRVKGQAHLSDTIGADGFYAGLYINSEGGWRDDAGVDQQKALLRWDREEGRLSIQTTLAAHNLNQETAGFIRGDDAYKNSALARTNPSPDGFRDAQAVRLASRIDWAQSDNLTLSVTPFLRWNEMSFRQTFLPSQAIEENGHWSVGALSAAYWSFEGGHDLIVGFDTEITDGFLSEVQDLPDIGSFTQGVHYDYDVLATVVAGYVHGEWQTLPRLRITGGLRVEYTNYDYTNNTDANTVGRFQRPADREDDFITVTPKLGAIYEASDEIDLFARYARGARAPQTTDLYRLQINQQVGDVDAETLDSIEAGLRGNWGWLTADIAAYYAVKRNFFFRDTDGFNVPDGRTRHVGVELDAIARLDETVQLALSGTYARHTYRFDNTVSVNSTESIRIGDDVDTAPRLLANARILWTPVPSVLTELEWVYVGDYFMDASNSTQYPGHQLVNLRAAWDVTDYVEVFAAVRNVTNTDYANRADFSFGSERYFPGEDRSYAGGIALRF